MKQYESLILDLISGQMSDEEFLRKFPVDLKENKIFILERLQEVYTSRNADLVEYALMLGFRFHSFTCAFSEVLANLLLANWHTTHEDIPRILEGLRDSRTVNALYEACGLKLKYLAYDDNFGLARKCIYALGAIGSEEATEKLMLLSRSPNKVIQGFADRQLKALC
ncbi:hypothetical protein EXU57_15780 [Segetibacter sp. 3557_3]|uniref:hypothetical protein n=1 Tax=Segetibacter sp. 3557_3 TaxID=2547429 RepID=UPI001058E84F|nr:hypothetical protein [Segetibacter sp. 3557_3]TDH23953.1 hypothetical protein EXU57_15780 [Segetibacter sp. 3557_3]